MAFLSSLFAIVLMDLVLAGDNALVIGLVARNLPKAAQRKAVICGTFGAIVVRAAMAVLIIHALAVPCFMLAGGIALAWISRKLLTPGPGAEDSRSAAAPAATLAAAVRTIVIADAIMGVDNVLAIGGAAHGSIVLVVSGLAISVPIIIWGSQIVIRVVDRYPSVILLGGAVLAWTGCSMVVREPLISPWLETHPAAEPMIAVLIFSISLAPWYRARLPDRMKPLVALLPALLVWLLSVEVLAAPASDHLIQGLSWIAWLPLAAFYLWARERLASRRPALRARNAARQRGTPRGRPYEASAISTRNNEAAACSSTFPVFPTIDRRSSPGSRRGRSNSTMAGITGPMSRR